MQRRRGDTIQCLFGSIKRVHVTRNTHGHTTTTNAQHARVGALTIHHADWIDHHPSGSRQDTHGTTEPAQWEGRGWLTARPQARHNVHTYTQHLGQYCFRPMPLKAERWRPQISRFFLSRSKFRLFCSLWGLLGIVATGRNHGPLKLCVGHFV